MPYLTGKETTSPRQDFAYFNDDGLLVSVRVGDWKFVFYEQRAKRFDLWRKPFIELRIPKIFNLRRDPFERADTDSNSYNHWWSKRLFLGGMVFDVIEHALPSFVVFPPRQKPDSFNLKRVLQKSKETAGK